MNNPWKLSEGEVATLDAMTKCGNTKLAARERELAVNTIQAQLWRAKEKMGARNSTMALLMFDRWAREA